MSRHRTVVALAALLLAAPVGLAAQSFVLGEALAPSFDAGEAALDLLAAVGPAALRPAVEIGAGAWAVLRVAAEASVVGASDGDVGGRVGTPDGLGVEADGAALDRLAVPATPVEAGGRSYEARTPGLEQTVRTPGLSLPARSVAVPGQRVDVDTPPVAAPAVTVRTPPLAVATPPAAVQRVEADRPGLALPGMHHHLDLDALDLNVQEVRGTLYLGPHAVPYRAGPFDVGEDRLPPEMPRRWDVRTERRDVLLPERLVLYEGGNVLGPHEVQVPSQEPAVVPGRPVVDGLHVDGVAVPGFTVGTPAVHLGAQERMVRVTPQHVATPVVPGVATEVPEVVVVEDGPDVPGASAREDPFGDVDDLGYFGYGQGGDSSLYPFACTGATGCLASAALLGPWVERFDGELDAALAYLDSEVVVRPG